MTKLLEKTTQDTVEALIKKLRTPTWGHGAFGETERYDPSQNDLTTALVLENLVERLKMADIRLDANQAELEYLRFFHNKAAEMYADGGTDEKYWIQEMFEEKFNKEIPEGY